MEDDVWEAPEHRAHVQPVEGRLNDHRFRQEMTMHLHSMFQTPALQAAAFAARRCDVDSRVRQIPQNPVEVLDGWVLKDGERFVGQDHDIL